jgi:PAS domain S-box-containing protein
MTDMAAEKKKPKGKKPEISGIARTLRDDAEKQFTLSLKKSPVLKEQTTDTLIHELQVHQSELETQSEELRIAQLALAESRDKYLDLYEFAPIGYLSLNNKSLVADTNLTGAVLLGVQRSSLIKARFRKFIVSEDFDLWHRYFDNVLYHEEKQICTLTLKRGDGSTFPARLDGFRIKDSNGVITVRIAFSDISDIRLVEDALRVSNKKLNLLSSITRHDINNELTVLLGYLEMLEMKLPDPPFNEYFYKAAAAANRITVMIKFTREYEAIGVNSPIWQDCRTIVNTAAKKTALGQVILKNDLPADTDVFADPLIGKVFYNLMDNAIRYGGKITTIRFSFKEPDGNPVLVCEDDGDGVVTAEKDKIFKRGFGKNTGLGLSLSREILSITGITIKETGEAGKGARFEMAVPKGAWRMTGRDD